MIPERMETERLILRRLGPQDAEPFLAFLASERSRFIGGPKARPEAWRALAGIIGHWTLRGFGTFAVTLKGDDTCIGSMGPWRPEGWPENELAWTIWSPAAEGKGYAFEAVRRLRRHAREDLGWTTAVSYIDPANPRSQALARRLGCVEDPAAPVPAADAALVAWRHPMTESAT